MERIQLANGVYLNYFACRKFKSNFMAMQFITPLHADTAAPYALFPRILRRGCASYPDMACLSARTQMLYGATLGGYSAYKRGEMQILGQSLWMLDDSVIPDGTHVFDASLALFEDVWFSPLLEDGGFRRDYVRTEKKTLCDALRARINNKNSYAAMRCTEEMCRRERFGLSEHGEEDTVERVSPTQALEAYHRVLSQSPCEIYYIGRGDADALARRLAAPFANVDRSRLITAETDLIRSAASVREVVEEYPAAQSRLILGFRTGSCEAEGTRPVMLMLNEIYGAGPLSKLFVHVREKRALCYSCYSSIEQIKGIMLVGCGIQAERRDEAQAEILAQLDEIRQGHITDAEMEAARRSLCSALTEIQDEPESMAMWHFGRRLSGQFISLAEELERIRSVTKADIAAAAERITLDTVYFLRAGENEAEEAEDDGDEYEDGNPDL